MVISSIVNQSFVLLTPEGLLCKTTFLRSMSVKKKKSKWASLRPQGQTLAGRSATGRLFIKYVQNKYDDKKKKKSHNDYNNNKTRD